MGMAKASFGGLLSWSLEIPCSSAGRGRNATVRTSCSHQRRFSPAAVEWDSGRRRHEHGPFYCERRLPLAGGHDSLRKGAAVGQSRSKELWTFVSQAAVKAEEPDQASVQASSPLKDFLEDLKTVGRVRLIVNTGVAVLESVTSLDKLYYHVSTRGEEYANVMSRDDNIDFHLVIGKVAAARLVKGKSMRGDIPTFIVRFVDVHGSVALSVFVMWKLGTDGDYDPGQVEAFQVLLDKYGEEVKFLG